MSLTGKKKRKVKQQHMFDICVKSLNPLPWSTNLSEIQRMKTASGYIWGKIIQFPWKPGKCDNCSKAKTLTLWRFFSLPVICLPWASETLQILKSPTFEAESHTGDKVTGRGAADITSWKTAKQAVLFKRPPDTRRGCSLRGSGYLLHMVSALNYNSFNYTIVLKTLKQYKAH